MPDIDLRLGDHARVFVTLAFDEFTGQYPRPGIDKDIADGHEGFIEFRGNLLAIRTPVGMSLAGLQVSARNRDAFSTTTEEVNVRSAFDGVRVGYDKPAGRIDLHRCQAGRNPSRRLGRHA